jgi:hypothetical protein
VEVDAVASGSDATVCPHCGGLLDSRPSRLESGEESAQTLSPHTREPTEPSPTTDWAQTWSRGSLGSLGRFQLRERLGDGGFGQVFLAYDPRLDRDVAVKVLKQANPGERVMERFFREARAVARLDHPNIAAVHDAGFDRGRCWVAYQLISGRPLWWYRDHQRMDAPTAVRIIRALADALEHAHRMGVVHRDIKPANVIIDDSGRPRLIDFGLARRSDLESDLTREGAIMGTPTYMSPEQSLGLSRLADERADVYGLGVIFFELLTGRRPDELTVTSRAKAVEVPDGARERRAAAVRARSLNRSIPRALDRICAQAMANNPADRHPSARALAEELDLWLKQRNGWFQRLWFTAGGVLVALAAALLLVLWSVGGATLPRTTTSAQTHALSLSRPVQPAVIAEVKATAPNGFVGNLETHLYHRLTCDSLHAMKEKNKVALEGAAQAARLGYRPCARCRP